MVRVLPRFFSDLVEFTKSLYKISDLISWDIYIILFTYIHISNFPGVHITPGVYTTLTGHTHKPFIISTSVLGAGAHGKASGNTSHLDGQEVVRALTSVFLPPMTD